MPDVKRRMMVVLVAATICIALLALRLLWIQLASVSPWGTASIARESVLQRVAGVRLDDGRGRIVDKNGNPLAGYPIRSVLLLPGALESLQPEQRLTLARILGVEEAGWSVAMGLLRHLPAWWRETPAGVPAPISAEQERAIEALALPGVEIVDTVRRYSQHQLAKHHIGFLAQQPSRLQALYMDDVAGGRLRLSTPIGASGLELAFDRFLHGKEADEILYFGSGYDRTEKRHRLQRSPPGNPYYPMRLVTTIDSSLQSKLEHIADNSGLKQGSFVVLDARTGDVIAMVSRPDYDPLHVDPSEAAWRNRALLALPPGSIMKSFITAVALEEGAVSLHETFTCDGTHDKYGLTCWKKEGHGEITFEEAFAQSCNLVFAELSERITPDVLERYGTSLGLIGTVGWSGMSALDGGPLRQFPEEEPSRIFSGDEGSKRDGSVLAQTAIGQRDVRITPLAAAAWAMTLLNGGLPSSPRAASSLQFADGRPAERYAPHRAGGGRQLSAGTVAQVESMMRRVVTSGTAERLRETQWPLAGKTGTAQATDGGRPVVHQWMIGWGPADQPRYVAAVVAESRDPDSSHLGIELFGAVMDVLARQEIKERR